MNFDFISPTKIFFGLNRVSEIGNIIKNYGYKRILLHYGKSSIKQNGVYDTIINALAENKIEVWELGGVEPNPKMDLVETGIKMVKENKLEMILAVGGGSVIDSSKAIGVGSQVDFDPWLFSIHEKTPDETLPVGVILTIAAAGSELSNSCVMSNKGIKNGFNSDLIRPLFALMDPTLTYSVSPYQTSCGTVDIMMHTLERYLTDVPSMDLIKNWALDLLKQVMIAGKVALKEPNNADARSTLMLASSLSHNGITGLGGKMYFTVHKLEHEISGSFDHVAHGAGLAVLFPAWAKVVYKSQRTLFKTLIYEVLDIKPTNNIDLDIENGIEKLKLFFKELGMPTTLKELGITKDDFTILIDHLTQKGTKMIPGFVELDQALIKEIFELAE